MPTFTHRTVFFCFFVLQCFFYSLCWVLVSIGVFLTISSVNAKCWRSKQDLCFESWPNKAQLSSTYWPSDSICQYGQRSLYQISFVPLFDWCPVKYLTPKYEKTSKGFNHSKSQRSDISYPGCLKDYSLRGWITPECYPQNMQASGKTTIHSLSPTYWNSFFLNLCHFAHYVSPVSSL